MEYSDEKCTLCSIKYDREKCILKGVIYYDPDFGKRHIERNKEINEYLSQSIMYKDRLNQFLGGQNGSRAVLKNKT